jgi:hypothetical protein
MGARRAQSLRLAFGVAVMKSVGRAGWATHWGSRWASLDCDAGCVQEMDVRPGWAGSVEIGPWPIENWKKAF